MNSVLYFHSKDFDGIHGDFPIETSSELTDAILKEKDMYKQLSILVDAMIEFDYSNEFIIDIAREMIYTLTNFNVELWSMSKCH